MRARAGPGFHHRRAGSNCRGAMRRLGRPGGFGCYSRYGASAVRTCGCSGTHLFSTIRTWNELRRLGTGLHRLGALAGPCPLYGLVDGRTGQVVSARDVCEERRSHSGDMTTNLTTVSGCHLGGILQSLSWLAGAGFIYLNTSASGAG